MCPKSALAASIVPVTARLRIRRRGGGGGADSSRNRLASPGQRERRDQWSARGSPGSRPRRRLPPARSSPRDHGAGPPGQPVARLDHEFRVFAGESHAVFESSSVPSCRQGLHIDGTEIAWSGYGNDPSWPKTFLDCSSGTFDEIRFSTFSEGQSGYAGRHRRARVGGSGLGPDRRCHRAGIADLSAHARHGVARPRGQRHGPGAGRGGVSRRRGANGNRAASDLVLPVAATAPRVRGGASCC